MKIDTVLFDLDGTLIDTNELIIASFLYTLNKYKPGQYTREKVIPFIGPPLIDTFAKINPGYEEEMVKTYRDHNHSIHSKYVKLFPNVIETIEELQKNEINMGIVTAKMRNAVHLGMELTGLDKYFETIVAVDDVKHSKPHPESVIKAMKELNGVAKSTLMVGDNYHDILAGKNAGVKTAGVAWSHKGEEFLASYNPTYMLQDMKDLLKIVGI